MGANAELFQRYYEAYKQGGAEAVADFFDPEVQWIATEPGPLDCHNREDVLQTMRSWKDDPQLEPDFEEIGDDSVLVAANTSQGQRLFTLLTLRDGKIVRMRDFRSRDEALA